MLCFGKPEIDLRLSTALFRAIFSFTETQKTHPENPTNMFSVVKCVFTYPHRLVVTLKRQHNTSNDEISYYYSASLEEVTEKHTKPSVDQPFTENATRTPSASRQLLLESGQPNEQSTPVSRSADSDEIMDDKGD